MTERREQGFRFAWEQTFREAKVSRAAKAAGLVAMTYSNMDGTNIRPGIKRLVAETGWHEDSIRDGLRELRETGWMSLVRKGTGPYADLYRLALPGECEDTATPPESRGTPESRGSSDEAPSTPESRGSSEATPPESRGGVPRKVGVYQSSTNSLTTTRTGEDHQSQSSAHSGDEDDPWARVERAVEAERRARATEVEHRQSEQSEESEPDNGEPDEDPWDRAEREVAERNLAEAKRILDEALASA